VAGALAVDLSVIVFAVVYAMFKPVAKGMREKCGAGGPHGRDEACWNWCSRRFLKGQERQSVGLGETCGSCS